MLKKILKSLYGSGGKKSGPDVNQQLINTRNLVLGQNSDISDVKINIFGASDNYLNIEIGDDCLIHGSIVLYSSNAKVKIGDRVFIGPNTTLFCYRSIDIADDVMISWGCTLIDTNAHSIVSEERKNDVLDWKNGWQYKDWTNVKSEGIAIKPKCWIGFNSIINKGVILDEGCVVASGSVVTKSFDEFSVLGGNPATFIKKTQ